MSRRTTVTLWVAAAFGALALLVWLVAFRTARGQAYDLAALQHLSVLRDTEPASLAERMAHLCDPLPFAMLSLSVAFVALLTGGLRTATVVGALLIIPNVLTQELKTALAENRPGSPPQVSVDAASWPSGHSTAAMVLALAAVIAAPPVLRWLVALLGAAFAATIGAIVVIYGWHLPSDVVGGFAVAGAAGAVAVLALGPGAFSRRAATTAPRSRWRRATG